MDNSQSNIGYFPQMLICDKHSSVELNSDFSLPDYQPEIRRLLSTKELILPSNEFLGNGNAEFSGEINYKITYLGADGGIYCTTLSDKYSFSTAINLNSHSTSNADVTLIPSCKAESVNVRVLGPRKLNVRSKLICRATAFSPSLYVPNLVGHHNRSSIENRIFETKCINIKKSANESVILNDFASFDSQVDNIRIIDCSSNALINECSTSDGKITVKGEVIVKLFYCNEVESAHPLSLSKKIPFSYDLACLGVSSSYECVAQGICFDERLDFQENGVAIELTLSLSATAHQNEVVKYIADAYSTERVCENSHFGLTLTDFSGCKFGNLTQNDVFMLESIKLSPDAKIVDIVGRSSINELSDDNGKLCFTGNNDYQLIYYLDGEYTSVSLSAPLRYELDSRTLPNNAEKAFKWRAESSVSSIKARHDGERLFVDCELNLNSILMNEHQIEILGEMVFGEHLQRNSSEILLCYPEKDSTLWSVAKKYGESQRALRQKNAIPEGDNSIKRRFLVI